MLFLPAKPVLFYFIHFFLSFNLYKKKICTKITDALSNGVAQGKNILLIWSIFI